MRGADRRPRLLSCTPSPSTAAVVLAAAGYAALAVAVLAIGAIPRPALTFGRSARLSALGVFYAGLPAVALIWLRSDEPFGLPPCCSSSSSSGRSDTAALLPGAARRAEAVAARVAQQDLGRACRRVGGRCARRRHLRDPGARGIRRCGWSCSASCWPSWRRPATSRSSALEAPVRRQGRERAHPGPRRLHGSRGRPGRCRGRRRARWRSSIDVHAPARALLLGI